MNNKQTPKRELKPRLRFPEFRDAGAWETHHLEDLIDVVTPPKKIPTSHYLESGRFPIVDQSQAYVAGRTDDEESVIRDRLPLIVFGDHTCALKLINEPFAQGADGIKIFGSSHGVTTNYLYQFLQLDPVEMEEYKRHFSILKEKLIVYPDIDSGEQQQIADCLSSIDELITAEAQKLDALKAHKKGLTQQLFPAEGETVPRLRFPEFRDAGEWRNDSLGNIFETTSGGTPDRSRKEYWNGNIPWITTSLVDFNVIHKSDELISGRGLESSSAKVFPKGTILIAMYGQGKTRGKVAMLGIEAATNQACAAILPQDEIDPVFVFLNLGNRYDELRELSNSGGQENLSQGLIRTLPFSFPHDIAEQCKIADCLSPIDELISAQGQKIDALKVHKKGLMQQLFPVLHEVEG